MTRPSFNAEGTHTPDKLLYNTDGLRTGELTVTAGPYLRGQIVTAAGAAMATGTDGYGILAEDADGSGGDVVASVYLAGEFNVNALDFGASNLATAEADLRLKGIFIRSAQEA
jgi:hypothetical protein